MSFINIAKKFSTYLTSLSFIILCSVSYYQYSGKKSFETKYSQAIIELKDKENAIKSLEKSYKVLQDSYSRQSNILKGQIEENNKVRELVKRYSLELTKEPNENITQLDDSPRFGGVYNELCYELFGERCNPESHNIHGR